MAGRLQDVILRGLAASKPLATTVAPGTLYFSTDTNVTERCADDGLTWQSYSGTGGGGGGTSTPNTGLCQGRLTTESGVPVSLNDRTAQGTIYFTPYQGNRVALYNGTAWVEFALTERSLALSGLTSGKNYDIFLYDNAGTLTLELSSGWATDTTRTDAIILQDGVWVKSGALTRRYVGMIRTTGTTTTEDSDLKRFVYSYSNRLPRVGIFKDSSGHSYNGAIRNWNGLATARIEFLLGIINEPLSISIDGSITAGATAAAIASLSLNGTDIADRFWARADNGRQQNGGMARTFRTSLGLFTQGYNYSQLREQSASSPSNFDEICMTFSIWM